MAERGHTESNLQQQSLVYPACTGRWGLRFWCGLLEWNFAIAVSGHRRTRPRHVPEVGQVVDIRWVKLCN